MIKDFALWLWDWAKRIFGRSKIVFTNIVGLLASVWVELADPISMFDWDSVTDKHEVVMGIGIAVSVLNVLFRTLSNSGDASFRALPMEEVEPDEESLEQSPKAY